MPLPAPATAAVPIIRLQSQTYNHKCNRSRSRRHYNRQGRSSHLFRYGCPYHHPCLCTNLHHRYGRGATPSRGLRRNQLTARSVSSESTRATHHLRVNGRPSASSLCWRLLRCLALEVQTPCLVSRSFEDTAHPTGLLDQGQQGARILTTNDLACLRCFSRLCTIMLKVEICSTSQVQVDWRPACNYTISMLLIVVA